MSITFAGRNYETAHALSGSNYAIIAYRYVLNIDTGEMVDLVMPEANVIAYSIRGTEEGWVLFTKTSSSDDWHISFYSATGGEAASTHTMKRGVGSAYPIFFPGPRPVKDIQKVWVSDDGDSLAGVAEFIVKDQKDCVQDLTMSNGAAIDLSGLDKSSFPCLDRETITVSEKAKVVTVGTRQTANAAPFSLMYNAATGEQIAFEGMDPASGATFTVAAPKQIIGYSPTDGTLTGYTPTSSQ